MSDKLFLYWGWVKVEARTIESDGCSNVIDFRKECCQEHDLAYFYGRDPRNAYDRYLAGEAEPWKDAKPVSRSEADALFRKCYHDRSPVNGFSPLKWSRWLGVRAGGWLAWRKHRKARP